MARFLGVARWLWPLCIASAASAAAQQFSADLVITAAGKPSAGNMGKINVSGSKVRIQTPELPDGFFLIDTDAVTAYFLQPARRLFMDAKQTSRLTQWLVPVDPDEPCARWQVMAGIAEVPVGPGKWHCTRMETVNADGHPSFHYRVIGSKEAASDGWIDPFRRFLTKLSEADGTEVALSDIQDGPQPDQLFQIPAGFRRFDPLKLIERIKQSDVWVERPN